jgi:hypothetical protein
VPMEANALTRETDVGVGVTPTEAVNDTPSPMMTTDNGKDAAFATDAYCVSS